VRFVRAHCRSGLLHPNAAEKVTRARGWRLPGRGAAPRAHLVGRLARTTRYGGFHTRAALR
jgi:hypothetical protein